MSLFISITVFSLVIRNLGLQVWGMSGVTAAGSKTGTTTTVPFTVMEDEKGRLTEMSPEEAFEEADRLERLADLGRTRSGDVL